MSRKHDPSLLPIIVNYCYIHALPPLQKSPTAKKHTKFIAFRRNFTFFKGGRGGGVENITSLDMIWVKGKFDNLIWSYLLRFGAIVNL